MAPSTVGDSSWTFPDVLTDDLDEAIDVLREYTRRLCSYRNVLDEVA